ncbi:unnamed protein product [Pieris macdunnoughi]|uniref:Uncharacterized protein n=1 Tax=Pieris macdunnoughi TaxID=345717 RepID=A0A821KTL7_9NEOP|nr:unnamed protein product [Pieris macdunnoughi]
MCEVRRPAAGGRSPARWRSPAFNYLFAARAAGRRSLVECTRGPRLPVQNYADVANCLVVVASGKKSEWGLPLRWCRGMESAPRFSAVVDRYL